MERKKNKVDNQVVYRNSEKKILVGGALKKRNASNMSHSRYHDTTAQRTERKKTHRQAKEQTRGRREKSFQTDIVVDQMNHAPNAFEPAL